MKKILKFSATWCQPCKMLSKNLAEAKVEVPIEEIDIDQNPELVSQYGIRGVPTMVMLEDEKEIKRISGVKTVAEISEWL